MNRKYDICVGMVALVLVWLCCAGIPFVEIPVYLIFGWRTYLLETLPKVSVDILGISSAFLIAGSLAVALHLFLSWFYRHLPQSPDALEKPRQWQFRWTGAGLAIVILMFVAGIATVGVAHQATWLLTAPEPVFARKIRSAVDRIRSTNNLKQIAVAVNTYAETSKGEMPAGTVFDAHGRAMHGWLTTLLPFVEQDDLYRQIDQKKPWNDPANAVHFQQIVKIYQYPYSNVPTHQADKFALAHYASNVYLMGGRTPFILAKIPDGASNTLLAGEVMGNYQPWGYPLNWRDPLLGINKSADGFGSPARRGAEFVLADGSARFISDNIDPEVLKALSTPDGGEPVDDHH